MLPVSELAKVFNLKPSCLYCSDFTNETPGETYYVHLGWLKALRFEYLYPEYLLKRKLDLETLADKRKRWEKFKALKPFSKVWIRKTRIKVEGRHVTDCRVELLEGDYAIRTTEEIKQALKLNLFAGYLLAVILKKFGERNVMMTQVPAEVREEFVYRGVLFNGYYEVLEAVKEKVKGLNKREVFRLLYFRPPWIGEVADKIVEFYALVEETLNVEVQRLLEEYYLRYPPEVLTPVERKLKGVIERGENPLRVRLEEWTYRTDNSTLPSGGVNANVSVVRIKVPEEVIRDCLPVVGRIKGEIVLKSETFETYLKWSFKDLCHALRDLSYLAENENELSPGVVRRVAFFDAPIERLAENFS